MKKENVPLRELHLSQELVEEAHAKAATSMRRKSAHKFLKKIENTTGEYMSSPEASP
jgi:hypothetical protein